MSKWNCKAACPFNYFNLMSRLFLILMSLLLYSCTNRQTAEEVINKALVYQEEGKFDQALKLVNRAVQMDSFSPTGYNKRGNIYLDLNDTIAAFADFTRAIHLDPKNTEALFNKGFVFSAQAKEDSAVAFYNLALKTKMHGGFLFRSNWESNDDLVDDIPIEVIRYYRAMTYVALESYTLALGDLYYALSYQYEEAECQYYIGLILIKQGQKLLGCDYLKKSVANGLKDGEKYLSDYCK